MAFLFGCLGPGNNKIHIYICQPDLASCLRLAQRPHIFCDTLNMTTTKKILILGAGELGGAIAEALYRHPSYDPDTISLAVAIRPETLAMFGTNSTSDRIQALTSLRFRTKHAVNYVATDLVADTESTLAQLFQHYTSVIHAGAMTLPAGTQLKVTRAALVAGVDEYVPWQWGVDYDVIGKEGGLGLFSEQCDVRDLLRSQTRTKWFILSCGMFMSFLFEDFWATVTRDDEGYINGVNALGGWDHLLTVTTVEDIARCNAELILVDTDRRDRPVYIAGETLRYDEFADMVEKVINQKIKRDLWTTDYLTAESTKDPENKLLQYRVVFSEGKGLAWPKDSTYNAEKGIEMEGVEQYMRRLQMR